MVVSHLPDDKDLYSLSCSCATFASVLVPEDSAIWKERFLSRYDYPFATNSIQFAYAYQIRRFVLRQFAEFTNPEDCRLVVQMEVLRDIVIGKISSPCSPKHCMKLTLCCSEAYNPARIHFPPLPVSKNLSAFASPHNSPWIRIFLSCFLFPCRGQRYGQRHPLFDALQLVLSYLLLSPRSQMAHIVKSSRANYDLAVVYLWNKPLVPLYNVSTVAETTVEQKSDTPGARRSSRKKAVPRMRTRPMYELDTHALLHIRNFWHRHLIDGPQGFGSTGITENTYGKMMNDLMRAGLIPKKWDRPLKDGDLPIATQWSGHYSTLAQWPKKKQELEEVQSLAEDWDKIDPLVRDEMGVAQGIMLTTTQKLDVAISTKNAEDGFWPPIMQSIPFVEKTVPDLNSGSCAFIRGLATFVDLSNNDKKSSSGSQATLTLPTPHQLPKYHSYLAMRLRGVIHSIPAQPQARAADGANHSIPGWNRIVMVLYKPNKRHLIQVLEHEEEEFGNSFSAAITTQMVQNGTSSAQIAQILNGTAPAGQAPDPVEIDALLDAYLKQKLLSNDLWRDGSNLDKDAIESMEEKYRLSEYLDWNDMDYAYAYEGAILPGGKIMMGRWWRLSMHGLGDGMEWSDALGETDDDGGEALDVNGDTIVAGGESSAAGAANAQSHARTRWTRLERGPFIFWC